MMKADAMPNRRWRLNNKHVCCAAGTSCNTRQKAQRDLVALARNTNNRSHGANLALRNLRSTSACAQCTA